MSKDGTTVTCHAWGPKKQDRPHQTSRVNCIVGAHEYCVQCPNTNFVLHIPMRIGDQEVACPRWTEPRGHLKGKAPSEYVQMRRESCLRLQPFDFCMTCPNSKTTNEPRSKPGWYEEEREVTDE